MRFLLPILLLAVAVVAGDGKKRKDAPSSGEPAAKRLFLQRCSACHDPSRVYHRQAARGEWKEIVDRMRRMPQSGISPRDAEVILGYLVSLRGKAPAPPQARLGGKSAFGGEWLSILQTATVRDGAVGLGRRTYDATRDGLTVSLRYGRRTRVVSLTADGKPCETSVLDRWRVGKTTYELHLVLYELAGDTVRVARALKKRVRR